MADIAAEVTKANQTLFVLKARHQADMLSLPRSTRCQSAQVDPAMVAAKQNPKATANHALTVTESP
jgi:hypothetical protein